MSDKKDKKLCKIGKKDFIKENLETYKSLVAEPKYLCTKCGRVSKTEDNLCKATEL